MNVGEAGFSERNVQEQYFEPTKLVEEFTKWFNDFNSSLEKSERAARIIFDLHCTKTTVQGKTEERGHSNKFDSLRKPPEFDFIDSFYSGLYFKPIYQIKEYVDDAASYEITFKAAIYQNAASEAPLKERVWTYTKPLTT